jgi:hypothetical protein
MDPQTFMTADPMHTRPSRRVFPYRLPNVGNGASSGNFLQFYLDCYNGSPGNTHFECISGSTNLHDSGSCVPGQEEVCILTDFRCGKGGLFRHPGETVRILQSVVVAGAHHVAVVIAGRALTPAKHTVLFIAVLPIHDILVWIRIRGSMPLTNGSGFGSGCESGSFYFRH